MGIGSGGRDESAAIRVPYEDDRAADPPQGVSYRGDIAGEGVEAELGSDHLVPLALKRGNHLAEGRAIGPDSVGEHDVPPRTQVKPPA